MERAQKFAEAGADILFVEAVTQAEEVRALPQRLAKPQLMNMVIGQTPLFNADQLGALGFGIVLYASAALQGAVMGTQNALTVLRDTKEVREDTGLVTPLPSASACGQTPVGCAGAALHRGTRAPQ